VKVLEDRLLGWGWIWYRLVQGLFSLFQDLVSFTFSLLHFSINVSVLFCKLFNARSTYVYIYISFGLPHSLHS